MCKEQFQHMENSYCDATVGLDQTLEIASLTQTIDKVPRKKKQFYQILEAEKTKKVTNIWKSLKTYKTQFPKKQT